MKITTCNNCGNIYEDINPGDESRDYKPRNIDPLVHGEDEDGFFVGCPVCNTDGYLVDNINRWAMSKEQIKQSKIIVK